MKYRILLSMLVVSSSLSAQELPASKAQAGQAQPLPSLMQPAFPPCIFEPPTSAVRQMAEWEELAGLAIAWKTEGFYPDILTQIGYYASFEAKVYVFCESDSTKAEAEMSLQTAGANMDNVEFLLAPINSIWIRDYGPNSAYTNDVENLQFVDWVYNRPERPQDDELPVFASEYLNIPLFCTTESPNRLVNTGGNFATDGLGTAFATKIVLKENGAGNLFGAGPFNEQEIDAIMQDFMGIQNYVKMDTLKFDVIHHTDMHFKLLDEETLLVGQYPPGTSDGPKIEANLAAILENQVSCFGTPYRVVRIQQPPDGVNYPPQGDYRTYTNSVFVNKTILIPSYGIAYDSVAMQIYRENFPGYKLFQINCNNLIEQKGALHCITKEIGSPDPLWIVHQRLPDIDNNDTHGDYHLSAQIKHKTGVSNATVYFTTDTSMAYQPLPLTKEANTDDWKGQIPHQANGTQVFYYIAATSNSGKSQVRPLPAPKGYYKFKVDQTSPVVESANGIFSKIYPNPTNGITWIEINGSSNLEARLELKNMLGTKIGTISQGKGRHQYFFDAGNLPAGTYVLAMTTRTGCHSQIVMVK